MLANIIRNTKKTAIGGGGGGIVTGGDPYYSAVSLLLPMDGTSGSTTFTDSSLNAIAVTAVGNTQISTTQSKYGGASGYFDGSGDYLDMSGTGVATAFGTGDFTIEFWYYPLSVSVQQNLVDKIGSASNAIYMSSAGVLKYYVGADRITGATLSASTWYHIALVRYSGVTKLYVNGVQSGASYTDTNNYALNTGSPRIGAAFNNTVSVNGYLDDLRISLFARYTSTFTPPTAALPTTASSTPADPYYGYTSLLLHMDGSSGSTNFVDSGPNAFTLTRYGTAAVSTTQSKFGGASAYFDGSGARLGLSSTAIDFGTGDFTAECWIYLNATPPSANAHIMGKHVYGTGASWILQINTSRVLSFLWNDGVNILSSGTALNLSQWYHIAASRSGSTIRIFINGTQVASTTISYTFSSTTEFTVCSASNDNALSRVNAYIDDLRVTKYARYTSAFAPPAQAFPNIYNPYASLPVSGAALWLAGDDSSTLYTDAGTSAVTKSGDLVYQWTDKSGNSRNAIQATSGNRPTWVAPANARNNLGAVAFNGTQKIDSSNNAFSFGTSDFTVECWFKVNVFPPTSGQTYSQFAGQVTSSATMGFGIVWTGSRYSISATTSTVGYFGSTSLSANTWYHAAFVRQSGTLKLYINGVLDGTYTVSTSISSTTWSVGANTASNYYFNGHLQYIAVYNGQAIYTANFTPWMS